MLRYHMAVVSADKALIRSIRRLTTSTGSTGDFVASSRELRGEKPPDLFVFDSRETPPPSDALKKVPASARIIHIVEGDALTRNLHLLRDERVTSLFCHDARFDDDEFICTATKALRGEVFGLPKYFPWGTTTFSMVVKSYEDKGKAIEILLRYAQMAGARGGVRDRIQLVCDELMMNALYHAPTDADGKERFAGKSLKELAKLDEVPPIEVRYGCSGRYFGVSVRDGFGSLRRQTVLDYLLRIQQGTNQIEQKAGGAGLGLISILKSCSKYIFHLDPGRSTEVIALFDMELFAKGKVGARSLHIFQAAPRGAADAEAGEEADAGGAVPRVSGPGVGMWLIVAILCMVLGGLGTAMYMRGSQDSEAIAGPAPAAKAPRPRITVHADPGDATVTLDGAEIPSGRTIELPDGKNQFVLRVEKDGFTPQERTIQRGPDDTNQVHWIELNRRRR